MQTILAPDDQVASFIELFTSMGRKSCLRDPLATSMADSGLGATQIHALLWLLKDQPLTMGALAQRVGVSDKTATGIVDRLERDEYVVRDRDGADRRVVHVRLAQKGHALAFEMDGQFRLRVAGFLGLLGEQDRADLFRILSSLAQNLEALGQAPELQAS
jgi:DNA-binding MarR family transcriptional regulator